MSAYTWILRATIFVFLIAIRSEANSTIEIDRAKEERECSLGYDFGHSQKREFEFRPESKDLVAEIENIAASVGRNANEPSIKLIFKFHPGDYFLSRTIDLGRIQKLSKAKSVVFCAAQPQLNQKAKLFGYLSPTTVEKVGHVDDSFIYEATFEKAILGLSSNFLRDHGQRMQEGIGYPSLNDEILQISRFPANGPLRIQRWSESDGIATSIVRDPKYWAMLCRLQGANVALHGFFRHEWADSHVRAKLRCEDGPGIISFQISNVPRYGIKIDSRFWIEDLQEIIFEDGKFSQPSNSPYKLLFTSKKLITSPSELRYPFVRSAFVGSARDVQIRDILIEGYIGAAIDISGERLRISNVKIRNAGLDGIVVKGKNLTVEESDVEDVGGIAINLVAGDRDRLLPGFGIVDSNNAKRFGRDIWSANPGIRIYGVGNSVLNNRVLDGPHAGIFFFGNENLISGNQVGRVAKMTDDVGGIYTGFDWGGRGNVVSDNLVFDMTGAASQGATGIYIDDQSGGTAVYGNTIINVDRGVLVGGGSDNSIVANVISAKRECIKIDERGGSREGPGTREYSLLVERLKKKMEVWPLVLMKYPELGGIVFGQPQYPRRNSYLWNSENCGVPNLLPPNSLNR